MAVKSPATHRLSTAIVIMFLMITGYAFGQDASSQELGLPDVEREKMILSPGEGESRYKTTQTTKDSVTFSRPQTPAPVAKQKLDTNPKHGEKATPKEDSQESILSFNFLYYIIQKYKLQDIVD